MSRKLKTTMSKEGIPTMIHKIDNAIKEIDIIKINHIKFCSGKCNNKMCLLQWFYNRFKLVKKKSADMKVALQRLSNLRSRRKLMKKNKQSLIELQDAIKHTDIHIARVLEIIKRGKKSI